MLSLRMLSLHKTSLLTAGIALAIASLAPVAQAQDADASTSSGKRVSIVGGVGLLEPTRNAWVGEEQRIKAHGDVAPTVGVTYHVNDNIGVEAWGAVDKYGHRVTGNDGQGKLGSVSSQPYALSGRYQFRDADATVRPFVGLGYYEQNFSDERKPSPAARSPGDASASRPPRARWRPSAWMPTSMNAGSRAPTRATCTTAAAMSRSTARRWPRPTCRRSCSASASA